MTPRPARVLVWLLATMIGLLAAVAGVMAQSFTEAERQAILAHGPWPQSWQPDAANPASGSDAGIALGRRLFFDAGLSPSGRVACSSCHRPERAWTDGRARGRGLGESQRNTPSILDARSRGAFGWRNERDSLVAQSVRPILDPVEMGSSGAHVRGHIAARPDLAQAYRKVFGRDAQALDAETVLQDAVRALAAFQETIVSPRTPFDDLRDAVARGDVAQAERYPAAARRGLALFVSAAGCATCHSGPAFSDGKLHAIATSRGTQGATYRTPSLRSATRTAPYLHDGSARTLAVAIRAHKTGPRLSQSQVADLVAFLGLLAP